MAFFYTSITGIIDSILLCFLFSQEDDGYEIQEGDEGFQRYLYEHYDACPETVEGGKGAFIVGESSKIILRFSLSHDM